MTASTGVLVSLTRQMAEDIGESACPSQAQLERWYQAACPHVSALQACSQPGLTVRFVSGGESRQLNATYRGKDKPTNVLSFPGVFAELPEALLAELEPSERDYLGDLAICPAVVAQEAKTQDKPLDNHYCHLFIHGLLHLMGYDHQTPEQAEPMEALETTILADLGLPNPYQPQ